MNSPHGNSDDKTKQSARRLSSAARRALDEANERRIKEKAAQSMREIGGRGGQDPVRFGDWEIKGRAIDF